MDAPRGEQPGVAHHLILYKNIGGEEPYLTAHGESLMEIGATHAVKCVEGVHDIQHDRGLGVDEADLAHLQLPEAFGFGEKAVSEVVRIPVLGTIGDATMAVLR